MVADVLLVERSGPVAIVTLNRPERRNAIDGALRTALSATFAELDADDAIRVVVLTGELIDAAAALASGLVTAVHPDGELAAAATDLAGRIAANAPLSLVAAKAALRAAEDLGLEAGSQVERDLWARLAATEDRAEGRAAFRERRPPRFTGR